MITETSYTIIQPGYKVGFGQIERADNASVDRLFFGAKGGGVKQINSRKPGSNYAKKSAKAHLAGFGASHPDKYAVAAPFQIV